jgi:hypothetical protein
MGKAIQIVNPATGKPYPRDMISIGDFDPAAARLAHFLLSVGGCDRFLDVGDSADGRFVPSN